MSSNSPDFRGPGPVQMYQDALTRGQFLIQQCKDCGNHVFYPRVMCNHCGGAAFRWVEPTGRGKVYSTSVVRRKAEKGGDYNVALITLEEGPRMMSRVLGMVPGDVRIGMAVSAHVGEIDGEPAVVFYAREQGNKEW